jgi:hypothetical protein
MELEGFNPAEEEMVMRSLDALSAAGYDTSVVAAVIRAELPSGYVGMTYLQDGIILGSEAFASQNMLNYVMEEELLHLMQKAGGTASAFDRTTVRHLEGDIDAKRTFHRPSGAG